MGKRNFPKEKACAAEFEHIDRRESEKVPMV